MTHLFYCTITETSCDLVLLRLYLIIYFYIIFSELLKFYFGLELLCGYNGFTLVDSLKQH